VEKRILIAVDGSVYSRKAMEYAAGIGSIVKNIHYTLLHIHPKVSEYLVEDVRSGDEVPKIFERIETLKVGDRMISFPRLRLGINPLSTPFGV